MDRLGIISLFVTGFLLVATSSHQIEIETKFINDLLLNENVPSIIVAKVSCWSKKEMISFSMSINFPVQFSYDDVVKNQPINEYSNKIWFLVDMKCEGSLKFVTMVNKLYP